MHCSSNPYRQGILSFPNTTSSSVLLAPVPNQRYHFRLVLVLYRRSAFTGHSYWANSVGDKMSCGYLPKLRWSLSRGSAAVVVLVSISMS